MKRLATTAVQHVRVSLAVVIAIQLALVLGLLASVEHNGWLTYQGGDQIWLMTSGWLLGQGTLPTAVVSYGWPIVIAPLTWVAGPSSIDLLPFTTLFQVLVLGPVATLAVYDIGARIAGRAAGLWCAALVVVTPYLATPLFVDRYQERWTDQVLVQATGLTQMADYPSTVAALVAGALVLRSLERARTPEALLAGTAASLMIAMKPSNAIFVLGPLSAYVLSRRWHQLAIFCTALAPAVLTLAVWKTRGLGSLPILAVDEVRLAAGATVDQLALGLSIPSAPFDLDDWRRNMSNLREFLWSARLAQWVPLAGALAVARVSRPAAGLLLGWTLAFFIVKGSSFVAGIENASFWRLVMPALPAYVILAAATPLLIPTLVRRLGSRISPVSPGRRVSFRTAIVTAAVVGVLPLVTVLIASPIRGAQAAVVVNGILVPVDAAVVSLSASREDDGQHLRWTDTTMATTTTFYRVMRTRGAETDLRCVRAGADRCELDMNVLGTTRGRTWVDSNPVPGATYRIGVAANWLDDPEQGDVFVVSPPVIAAQ